MRTVSRRCVQCGGVSLLEVDADAYHRWELGEHAQVVWPDWSASEREVLISGTHAACWEEIFWMPDELDEWLEDYYEDFDDRPTDHA